MFLKQTLVCCAFFQNNYFIIILCGSEDSVELDPNKMRKVSFNFSKDMMGTGLSCKPYRQYEKPNNIKKI